MKQIILFILFFPLLKGFSQSGQDSTAENSDSAAAAASTLTIGAVYANNADYYGQKAEESMP